MMKMWCWKNLLKLNHESVQVPVLVRLYCGYQIQSAVPRIWLPRCEGTVQERYVTVPIPVLELSAAP
ncbi:hypothetical protein VNO80_01441 [Phaseolus coccineus]|uniref:Uncharacterized protein n=1 Tax=Phaseolus coccineus TaxID=3886 RepID=A0AAN9RSV3_PHACN